MYYKIVHPKNGSFWSTNYAPINENVEFGTCLEYVPYIWTFPKIKRSKLFIFSNLEHAIQFYKRGYRDKTIFECKAINPKKTGPINIELTHEILKAIKNKKKYTHLVDASDTPLGTLFCDAVQITKRVKI